jgi:UDP-N-acetylmuramyl pentapeptide phosphotransferase/UDP-N-acetylglucosamine-1-phosphate transferase
MLGDTGAHALGAALGTAAVTGNRRAGLLAHAVAFVAAAVYGEKVSEAARSWRIGHIPVGLPPATRT